MDYESDPGWQFLRRSREQILEDQSKPYDSKKNVWISDVEEGYVAAEIKSTKGDYVTVGLAGGIEKVVNKEEIQEMNPPKFDKTEDMSNLTFLNDAAVLTNLRARYSCMLIYTYSGLFCVVINPYKRLPIYTDSVARLFMGKRKTEMPPHLFAASDEAYRSMLQNSENQSMLITGESGAGKTENTKKVIAYFASVGASQQEKEQAASGKPVEVSNEKRVTLEDKIVQTNPVLEAFGNAKTVRNNNSSRFGKFIRIHFTKTGKVASCDIEHYLLEKSRVIRQAPGERCYHIFYQIFSGYKPELIKDLLLSKPVRDYYFIAQAELTIDGINDCEEHQLTDEAFRVLNFTEDEIRDCYRLVAAMMHMGNMKFKQRPREEQAEADGTDDTDRAAKMYGVATEDFLKALLRPRVKVGTEWVSKGQNMEQVAWSVGAMAKGLYSRMFNWLVVKCNKTLSQTGNNKDFFIGVLDIAGFEIFDFNSFEQLWINFVNEKLQQFFNHHMFVLEQEEYAREGIEWVFIDFGLDLQACIELIEKPMGIIAMLDEECIVPKASDLTLAQKLLEQHLGKHPNFEKPKPPKGKQAEAHFSMRHYAGTVRYNVSNWLEKNKDPLNDSLVSVMKNSENKLLIEVWSDYTTQEEALAKSKGGNIEKGKKKGKSGSFMTVSMIYRESLNNLMTMLNTTHPHFIRCIIPNEKKQAGVIDASLVLNQLTCNGVLEGIRICRKGFPNRMVHIDFVQRYLLLASEDARSISKDGKNAKNVVEKMLQKIVKSGDLKKEQFRIGLTKVFFKAGTVAQIEDLRDRRLSFLITALQTQIRWHYIQIDKARRKKQISGVTTIQNNVRQWVEVRTWLWFKLIKKVKPLLEVGKEQEIMDAFVAKVSSVKEKYTKELEQRTKLEQEAKQISTELLELQKQIKSSSSHNHDTQDQLDFLNDAKASLEQTAQEVTLNIANAEEELNNLLKNKKRAEAEAVTLKKNIVDLDVGLKKVESEKQFKENQIRNLVDEKQKQEATLAKINREKKHQEEIANKLVNEFKTEEDRGSQEKSVFQKLQSALESAESELDREKRVRAEADKARRKLDGELRIMRENLEELIKHRQDSETSLKKKEAELFGLTVRFQSAQSGSAKSVRMVSEHDVRVKGLEADLDTEREARERSERLKNELQYEVDELQEQLDQHNNGISLQIEANKKKDAECAKLRREIDQLKMSFESQNSGAKKKGADGLAELQDQIEQLQRLRTKSEKEKSTFQKQLREATLTLEEESKQRNDADQRAKLLKEQLNELRLKMENQTQNIQEASCSKNRLQAENAEFTRQAGDLESQIANISRLKSQFGQQTEELRRAGAEEAREKQSMKMYSKNLLHELDQMRDSLEDEIASKSEVIRQLTREQNEAQQWRHRFESEGLVADEDVEEIRRRQIAEIAHCQNELDTANARLATLERQRSRVAAEVESARADADNLGRETQQLEKRQAMQDKILEDWRHKYDGLQNELDAAQRESRQQSTEAMRLRSLHDQTAEQLEVLRRENKQLLQDIHDSKEQISESARSFHELESAQRRLDIEKDELQLALDEAEAALEAEENKVLRSQVEVAQIRTEIEKRLQEKEEEFENIRKNHLQSVESLQSSLDQESRTKMELQRAKKKLETDVSDFQLALEQAMRANEDAQNNVRRNAENVKELQRQIEEDQNKRDEFHEKFLMEEKRLQAAKNEYSEASSLLETLQRSTKQIESDISELQIQNSDLQNDAQAHASAKSKVETELALLRADLNEARNEVQAASDRSKRAAIEAARIAEELRIEQERSNVTERQRKALEFQIKDMQGKIDEAEHSAHRGGVKAIAKLETQLKNIENELENEQRRQADAEKGLGKADRRSRELQFQVEEERKNYAKLCDLAEKLQTKIKAHRRSLEEAEESANSNLQKFRTVQIALDNAQERADNAESTLIHVRSRSRVRGGASSSAPGVSKSETVA